MRQHPFDECPEVFDYNQKEKRKQILVKWRFIFKIMVNKVDGNNYYVYTKQKKIDVPDTGEKFNLGYNKNESSPETKDKKEVSEQEKQQAAERSGVMLELSSRRQNADAGRQKQTEAGKEQSA